MTIRRWGAVESVQSDGTLGTSEGRRLYAHIFEALSPAGGFNWSSYGSGTGAVFGLDTGQQPHAGKMIILSTGTVIGAFGDLNGSYGYATSTAAMGLGNYGTSESLTIDATNGIRFFNSTPSVVLQMSSGLFTLSGEIRVGDSGTPGDDFNGIRIYKSGSTYRVEGQDSGTVQVYIGSDGKLYAAGGQLILDYTGLTIIEEIAGGTYDSIMFRYGTYGGNLSAEVYGDGSATAGTLYLVGNPDQDMDDGYAYLIAKRGVSGQVSLDLWADKDNDEQCRGRLVLPNAGYLIAQDCGSGAAVANIGLSTTSWGGGKGVLAIKDANTVPGSNPSSGGILYCDSGALKYRGSSGTVTTIANA